MDAYCNYFGNLSCKTFRVWDSRKAESFFAKVSSVVAKMAMACKAAFAAPDSPIANVATGIPLGICTIERSESSPFKYREGTGTPKTGTIVLEANIPGK